MRQNAGKKRKIGQRLKPGMTKAKILLFLASNGEAEFSSIRKHIEEELGIGTTKPIRDQLTELEKEGIINKLAYIKYANDYCNYHYSIKRTFHALKKTYTLQKNVGMEKDFMQSNYFTEYVISKEFRNKFRLNLYKTNMVSVYNEWTNNSSDHFEALEEEFGQDLHTTILPIFQSLNNDNMDELYATLTQPIEKEDPIWLGYLKMNLQSILDNFIITKRELTSAIEKILLSPRALNFVLNPPVYTYSFLATLPLKFASRYIVDDSWDDPWEEQWYERYENANTTDNTLPETSHPTPTYQIIKTLFSEDRWNDDTIDWYTHIEIPE